ncbi:MAG TPA: tRNA (N(6)-L-threonylcarbamoyladenosine(37)-C(2))-methylthiotransferase MtaB [Acidobacteriota bacterium]|jgi:MiaB-like tRNA modifying enzyme
MAQKFYLATFGCRVNQADSAAIKKRLEDRGLRQSEDIQECSLIIVNSCTVTHRGDQQVRQLTRKLRRENPAARLIMTGCYAQRDPRAIAEMNEVDLVLGNSEKERIGDFVRGQLSVVRGQLTSPSSAGQQVSRSTGLSSVISHQSSVIGDSSPNPQSAIPNPQSEIPHSAIRNPQSEIPQSAIRNPQSEIPHSAFPNPQSEIPQSAIGQSAIRIPHSLPLPSYFGSSKIFVSDLSRETEIEVQPATPLEGKTRPFVKIQEGCDSRCSYCIVPFVRGAGRSVPPESVLAQARDLVGAGYKEIVLTGIHLGSYGNKLKPRLKLEELIRRLLDLPGLEQLRLSSIEPMRFSPRLIDLAVEDSRLAPHFHLPLQSSSDLLLRAMNRTYHKAQYAGLICEINRRIPHASIGADVMVGFPGESEQLFEETRQFIKEMPFSYLHVFPFSRRSGTVAAEMPNQVEESEKSRRVEILRRISGEKLRAFEDRFLGASLRALVLRERERGYWTGLTGNYIKLKIPVECAQANEFVSVRLERSGEALYGVPIYIE